MTPRELAEALEQQAALQGQGFVTRFLHPCPVFYTIFLLRENFYKKKPPKFPVDLRGRELAVVIR